MGFAQQMRLGTFLKCHRISKIWEFSNILMVYYRITCGFRLLFCESFSIENPDQIAERHNFQGVAFVANHDEITLPQ